MTTIVHALPLPDTTDQPDLLLRAVAGYLARYKGLSRNHIESDLRVYLRWCTERSLDPLTAQRPHVELYVRWMQEIRRFKPSTVSRRMSIVAGFYRTATIDEILTRSPAEHVRRPNVPPESPTLGLTHLQFEAMLTAARDSTNTNDFALVVMLGLLGLRIFEATGTNIADLGEEHGHRVLTVPAKATGSSWCRYHPPSAGPWTALSATAPTGRCCATPARAGWTATPPPSDCDTSPTPVE